MLNSRLLRLLVVAATPWLCSAGQAKPASSPSEQPASTESVVQAARELFDAAQSGDPLAFKPLLDEAMVSHAAVRDGYAHLAASEDQIRYHLSETSTGVSDEFAEVRARWERRSLSRPGLKPQLRNGLVVLQFRWTGSAWRLRGIGGDSPFIPARAR